MKTKGSSLFLFFALAVGVAFLIMSLNLPSIEDKLAPLLFSGFLIILAVAEGTKTFLKSGAERSERPGKRGEAPQVSLSPGRLKELAAWMGGPILGICLLGFNVTIPLFTLTCMKLNKVGWLKAVIISAAATAFFVFGCEHFLQIRLYKGWIFELLE